jgi:hypothetical protein
MTDLWHSLLNAEYSYLQVVAEKWGFELTAPDVREGIDQVTDAILAGTALTEIESVLPSQEQEVMVWLDEQGGRTPWDRITRKFGPIREMGAGRLDRERPDRDPISPTESLWYRALIARGFFETETGPQEFAYIPDDLREAIMPTINPNRAPDAGTDFICRKASPRERAEILAEPWFILDQLCTYLAGLRTGLDPSPHMPDLSEVEEGFYQALAEASGLLESPVQVSPEAIRDFLDLDDPQALKILWDCWQNEEMTAELYLLPEIEVEGDPPVEPLRVRKQILSDLSMLPKEEWWSIESFLTQVKERHPDFLRSGGEYQSWFIRQKSSDEYLTGFKYWDVIEGELLRFFITGPLYWLGLINLAAAEEESPPRAFKLSSLFTDFMADAIPDLPDRRIDPVQLRSQGEIHITKAVPRKARYLIARFCDWHPVKADAYQYRLSPRSLKKAEEQDLRVPHLLALLKNYAEAIPPNLLAALERWEKSGSQATIEPRTVLRLGSPAILKALKSSRAERYILEQLGPTSVIIHPDSESKVAQALMELGFFVDVDQSASQM